MILIDYKDRRPLYEQIVERIQELIYKEILKPDEQLPSVRNLAMELSINPNTIQRAYGELERTGFIYSIKGKGNFVAYNQEIMKMKKNELKEEIRKLITLSKTVGMTEEEIILFIENEFRRGEHD